MGSSLPRTLDLGTAEAPPLGLAAGLKENLVLTLDLSSRASLSTDSGEAFTQNVVGIDLRKMFSGPEADWGTLLFQGYLTRIANQAHHPPFFEDDDDWELVYRIANLNLTRLARGKLNLRVGHFEIPYGLEQSINTNGTLRDYTHGRNLGVKADWGTTINGVFPGFEYEVSASRGTGNEYFDRGNPHAVAGRIGTPSEAKVILGLSAFYGRVSNPGAVAVFEGGSADPVAARDLQAIVRRSRFGADLQWHFSSPFALLGEVSVGRDYNQDVCNALVELDWRSPGETFLVYLQTRCFAQRFAAGWDDALSCALGARYNPDATWALSAQYTQDFTTFFRVPRDAVFSLQLRFRF